MTPTEQRIIADMRSSIDAAARMLARFEAQGEQQSLFSARTQLTQCAQWVSELIGMRARQEQLQRVWEDTRTQRDELLAHIADKKQLPQWAVLWLDARNK